MYAVVIGFLITFIVGYLLSWLFYLLKIQGKEKIYIEGSINEINTDLFVPPLATRMRKKFARK